MDNLFVPNELRPPQVACNRLLYTLLLVMLLCARPDVLVVVGASRFDDISTSSPH